MTCCAPIPSTISEKLNIGVLLGGLVAVSFQSTASSCKFSAALYSIFQHQNREDCHIVGWDYLWEEEDNIFFDMIFRVSYLQRFREQCFLRESMMHLKGLQN